MWEESILNENDLNRVYRYACLTTAAVAYGTTLWLFGNKIERFVSSAVQYGTNKLGNISISQNTQSSPDILENSSNRFYELKALFNSLPDDSKRAILLAVAAELFYFPSGNTFRAIDGINRNLGEFKKLEGSEKSAQLHRILLDATTKVVKYLQDSEIIAFTNNNTTEFIDYNNANICLKAANIYYSLQNVSPKDYLQRRIYYFEDDFMNCINEIEQIKELLDYQPPKPIMRL